MPIDRPDLTQVSPTIRTYIESLETEIQWLTSIQQAEAHQSDERAETTELPTTVNLLTINATGIAKRTFRHLYSPQRRGGMGIFDLDAPLDDPPVLITLADENQSLILFSNMARAFRFPINFLPVSQIRSRGQSISDKLNLLSGEYLTAALPYISKGAYALVSQKGMVRHLRHHIFGEYMKPGTVLFNPNQFGPLVAACNTSGEADLFIATRQGRAIRFSEKLISPQGSTGIRLEPGDTVVAVTSVQSDDGVFLIDASGNGTIRLMSGFAAVRSAGGSGKIAMNTNSLIGAIAIKERTDIFLISWLSKIIRFPLNEVPEKENPVQGVNCMSLRADEVVSAALS